jgi:hypothetical protein
MQLIVNGNQTHVLDVSPGADVACLRAQLSMLEGVDCEQVNILYFLLYHLILIKLS